MKATLVPDLLTRCTALEVCRGFRGALETIQGRTPSNAHLAVLVAQSALESGRWRSMHRWNFGNVKASPTYEYLYCQFRCNEVINGTVQWFDPPHPQTNFRAFMDLETGAIDHVRFLSQRKSYTNAWWAAQKGDPAAFVHALKTAGYFTASEGPYLKAVKSLFAEYMRLLDDPSRDTMPPSSAHEEQEHAAAILTLAPDPARLLHTEAVLAMASYDPTAAARDERRAQMLEP